MVSVARDPVIYPVTVVDCFCLQVQNVHGVNQRSFSATDSIAALTQLFLIAIAHTAFYNLEMKCFA